MAKTGTATPKKGQKAVAKAVPKAAEKSAGKGAGAKAEPVPRGKFIWHELVTSDPTAAIAYYTKLIGWGTQKFPAPPGAPPYTMWTVKGNPIGGVMKLPDAAVKMGAQPHWLAYITTPDVDKTAAEAKKLGGKVLMGPDDIPTVGRFAIVADPDGAVFAPFAPKPPEGSPPMPQMGPDTIGAFSWNELATKDSQAAFRFYKTLFGWEETGTHDMGPMGVYRMFGQRGVAYGGMYSETGPAAGMPPHWLHYIHVENCDKTAAEATKLGGKVLNGPMDVPGGDRIAQGVDPQGAMFAIHSKTKK